MKGISVKELLTILFQLKFIRIWFQIKLLWKIQEFLYFQYWWPSWMVFVQIKYNVDELKMTLNKCLVKHFIFYVIHCHIIQDLSGFYKMTEDTITIIFCIFVFLRKLIKI